MSNWEEIRQNYPLIKNNCYFNTASFGAISRNTLEAQKKYLDTTFLQGNRNYDEWIKVYKDLKNELSSYFNISSENLGLIPDASNGINKAAELLKGTREVILIEDDFPSIILPWITRKYKINWIKKNDFLKDPAAVIETQLKKGNQILALSWVNYNSGFMADLDQLSQLCSKYDAYFVVDATQGLGAYQLDLSQVKVDFLTASCFKWFMSGYGVAIAYFSDRLLDGSNLPFSGWNTLKNFEGSFMDIANYKSRASRMEVGHLKYQYMIALNTSFMEMKKIGFDHIADRTSSLANYLKDQLKGLNLSLITPDSNLTSGIVCIQPEINIATKLKSSNITCTIREKYIRFSVYFYNNKNDIDYLISSLKS